MFRYIRALRAENRALKRELNIAKSQRDTYLKELQRKVNQLRQVG